MMWVFLPQSYLDTPTQVCPELCPRCLDLVKLIIHIDPHNYLHRHLCLVVWILTCEFGRQTQNSDHSYVCTKISLFSCTPGSKGYPYLLIDCRGSLPRGQGSVQKGVGECTEGGGQTCSGVLIDCGGSVQEWVDEHALQETQEHHGCLSKSLEKTLMLTFRK